MHTKPKKIEFCKHCHSNEKYIPGHLARAYHSGQWHTVIILKAGKKPTIGWDEDGFSPQKWDRRWLRTAGASSSRKDLERLRKRYEIDDEVCTLCLDGGGLKQCDGCECWYHLRCGRFRVQRAKAKVKKTKPFPKKRKKDADVVTRVRQDFRCEEGYLTLKDALKCETVKEVLERKQREIKVLKNLAFAEDKYKGKCETNVEHKVRVENAFFGSIRGKKEIIVVLDGPRLNTTRRIFDKLGNDVIVIVPQINLESYASMKRRVRKWAPERQRNVLVRNTTAESLLRHLANSGRTVDGAYLDFCANADTFMDSVKIAMQVVRLGGALAVTYTARESLSHEGCKANLENLLNTWNSVETMTLGSSEGVVGFSPYRYCSSAKKGSGKGCAMNTYICVRPGQLSPTTQYDCIRMI